MKKLIKVTDRVYYYPCEEERDRPLLGYVRGDRYALAVDAGHSKEHVEEFYRALQAEGLPLPDMTILTHWHWDHTFGMHAIHGISIANETTNGYLKEISDRMCPEEALRYIQMDPHIAAEYATGQEMKVVPADIEFAETLRLDLGGTAVQLMRTVSPHTEDSTLVYVPQEQTLFIGDSMSGAYPEWIVDQEKMKAFIQTIESIECEHCLTGHWKAETRKDLLTELRSYLIDSEE